MTTPSAQSTPKHKRALVVVRDGRRRVRWPMVWLNAAVMWPVAVLVSWGFDAILGTGKGWPARIITTACLAIVISLGMTKMMWDRLRPMPAPPKRRT